MASEAFTPFNRTASSQVTGAEAPQQEKMKDLQTNIAVIENALIDVWIHKLHRSDYLCGRI